MPHAGPGKSTRSGQCTTEVVAWTDQQYYRRAMSTSQRGLFLINAAYCPGTWSRSRKPATSENGSISPSLLLPLDQRQVECPAIRRLRVGVYDDRHGVAAVPTIAKAVAAYIG